MGQEIVFKSAAFGFNKEDVMNYISIQKAKEAKLLEEIENLKKADGQENPEANELAAELLNAKNRILALETEKDRLEQEKRNLKQEESLIDEKEQSSSELLIGKEEEINKLKEQLLEKDDEISRLKEQLNESSKVAINSQATTDSDIESTGFENMKSLESQLGSAIIDARRFSDRLVHDAKSKSAKISSAIYLSINETTGKVNTLSEEIEDFKADFEEALRELTIKLDSLKKNLDGTAADIAQQLEKNKADCELPEYKNEC